MEKNQNALLPRLILQKGREEAVKRQHPWIFSGAIKKIEGAVQDGDLVEVVASGGSFLARGHYHDGSIMVRVLSFEQRDIDADFWQTTLANALALRQQLQIGSTCYRLVHGEGDGLPGLIVDMYGGVAVVQAHTIGMHRSLPAIVEGIKSIFKEELVAIYDKSRDTLPGHYASSLANGYLYGAATMPFQVTENQNTFVVDWETGQKTGFYLDQRENRSLLASYAKGRSILNTFCYSGGFSVYALNAGAESVTSVDASARAIALCEANVSFTSQAERHLAVTGDAMVWLKSEESTYDVVILDPPAFAKSLSARHRAVQGYKRLNILGIGRVKPGGLLFTFSCSQVVDRELFYNTVVAACMEVGRKARVIHQLTQGPDHPVNAFHPEGSYLKGLVLRLD